MNINASSIHPTIDNNAFADVQYGAPIGEATFGVNGLFDGLTHNVKILVKSSLSPDTSPDHAALSWRTSGAVHPRLASGDRWHPEVGCRMRGRKRDRKVMPGIVLIPE
jgi:hypothetical protein